jgi:hypothetical protein
MTVVIDNNTLNAWENEKDQMHEDLLPVVDWIKSRKGVLVYGGKTYIHEITKIAVLKLIKEWSIQGLAIKIDDELIQREIDRINSLNPPNKFDDRHILALLLVSKVCLLVTLDGKSIPFIEDKTTYYPKIKIRKIKFYQNRNHINLLCNKNIVNIPVNVIDGGIHKGKRHEI